MNGNKDYVHMCWNKTAIYLFFTFVKIVIKGTNKIVASTSISINDIDLVINGMISFTGI
jgi:hypothetical protein